MTKKAAHNSSYKKLAVQWLNEALCFVSSFVGADSLVLRNRQLLVAAKRYPRVSSFHFDINSFCQHGFVLRHIRLPNFEFCIVRQ